MSDLKHLAISSELKEQIEEDIKAISALEKSTNHFPELSLSAPTEMLLSLYPADGFMEQLIEVLDGLEKSFFGLTYEIEGKKTLKKDTSSESLVRSLVLCEKRFSKQKVINEQSDWFGFFKVALEQDVSLQGYEKDVFERVGLHRDRSGLSLPQKHVIAVQCAAQVLFDLRGESVRTIADLTQELLSKRSPFFDLLELQGRNTRNVQNWVRPVFPLLPEKRKKRDHRLIKGLPLGEPVEIPEIFSERGVNFLAIRFALSSLTRILKVLGWTLNEIIHSKFVKLFTQRFAFHPVLCQIMQWVTRKWLEEAYLTNGSIYT